MVICLERGAGLHMVQLMPLPLTVSCFSKSRLVIPFWYRLTRVVPEKGPLNGVCVCVYRLTRVVPEKGPLNGVCVCVYRLTRVVPEKGPLNARVCVL